MWITFYSQPVFSASSKFIPISQQSSATGFSEIASQYGINIGPSATELTSAEMFPELIKSRTLAKQMLFKKFFSNDAQEKDYLINILNNSKLDSSNTNHSQKNRAIKKLLRCINVKTNRKSGSIIIRTTYIEPKITAELNNAVVSTLSEILTTFNQEKLKKKKYFIENRIKEALVDLTNTEDMLKEFREKNRQIMSSPALLLEQQRLLREVEVKTQVYITLKTQLEMVQIEQVQKGNQIQVLDEAVVPLRKSGPNYLYIVLFSLAIGIVIAITIILIRQWLHQNKSSFIIS